MTDLTPESLAELRRLATKATPGPWTWRRCRTNAGPAVTGYLAGALIGPEYAPDYEDSILTRPNARYVAAANPATTLALLDRIGQLETERVHLERGVAQFRQLLDTKGPRMVSTTWEEDTREWIEVDTALRAKT